MLELFGVSPGGPLVRLDGMGVAVMLALSRHSSRITGLDRSGAVFVTKTGANHTFQRFRYDLADLVPWWHCPALASPRSAAH